MVKEKGTKKGGRGKIIGIIIAVIVILGIIGSMGGGNDTQQADNSQITEAVSQTPATEADQETDTQEATTAVATTAESTATLGESNALDSAMSYLNFMAFSKEGLIYQLEYEGYSNEEAKYAVKNCGADWNEQALKKHRIIWIPVLFLMRG